MRLQLSLKHIAGPPPADGMEAPLAVFSKPISFLGEVDPVRGAVRVNGGLRSISGTLMVFPQSRGSTVGSYVVYALSYYRKAPKAMIVENAEPLLITGCVIGEIPLLVTTGGKPDYSLLEKCGRGVIKKLGYREFSLECEP